MLHDLFHVLPYMTLGKRCMMIKTLAEKVAELAEENAKLAQQVQVIEKING